MWVHAQQRLLSSLTIKLPLEVGYQGPHELYYPFCIPSLFSAMTDRYHHYYYFW